MEKGTLFVKASYLTTIGEAGVEGKNTFLTKWRRQEKLTEVLCKDFNSFFVGTFLTQGCELILHTWIDKTLEGVLNSLADKGLTKTMSTYKLPC